ncbi:MAG TPA: thioredoxin domain-containing protein [Polyangiaceae bacterium]
MSNDKEPEKTHSKAHADEGAGMNTGVAIVGFVLCFFAGMALMWGYDARRNKDGISGDSSAVAWSDSDSPIPIDSKDPMWGHRDAPVTIVQFSDYQCPFCSRVEPTMDQVKQTYGPDKVRVIWKNNPLPFHPNAKPAAEAAQGVFAMKGNDAFWKFHDEAFKNQKSLGTDSYVKWAQEAGVTNVADFQAGLTAHKWADKVDKDNAEGKQVGVNGTPGFYINGVEVSGAQPFDKFKAVIDAELAKAQAKIASGTPKDKVYVAMSTENKKAAPAKTDEKEDDKEDSTTVWKVPVGKSAATWGGNTALVTIIEFSDFQCPYCKRAEPTLKQIHDTYGDKVRLVWKNEPLPFHDRAEPAAEVAMEARAEKGDAGFWAAHDALFDSQPNLKDEDLDKVTQKIGLNMDKVHDAMKNHTHKAEIDADQDVGEDFNASGTPHFFVNGRRLVGAQPFEKFKPIIDEEITKANTALAKGAKPANLYDTLVADGKEPPPPEKKDIPVPTNGPTKGNPKAKVTILEISDFQCPFCKRVEDQSMAQVMKDYGDKVKVVWRNKPLPMHPDAPLAAQAAMEAFKQKGSDGFWKYHDTLFANQQTPDGLKRPALEKYAQDMGLDMTKFKAALDSNAHKAEVDADAKVADDAGISGTPAFSINGYFVNGAQPYGKFRKLIERALAEAK